MIVLTLFKVCPKSKVFRPVFIEVDLKVMNFLILNNNELFSNWYKVFLSLSNGELNKNTKIFFVS